MDIYVHMDINEYMWVNMDRYIYIYIYIFHIDIYISYILYIYVFENVIRLLI